ncbi:TPA: trypsin-like serine peptidase [Staphylococcus pseudintermedius]
MFKNLRLFTIISLLFLLVFSFSFGAKADSYVKRTVNERSAGIMEAQDLVQKISNQDLLFHRIDRIDPKISGIGILSNVKNKVYGTAFVVDDHTILTNNHVVEKGFGTINKALYDPENPENLKFTPSRDGHYIPYTFSIKDIKMITGVDVAIVHTNEKLTNYVQPLKIANEDHIKTMNYRDKIVTYGYPAKEYLNNLFSHDLRYKMYQSEGFYLLKANSEDPQFYSKMIIRMGNSGSSIFSANDEVIGINSGGMNNTNANATIRAQNEMAYAFSFTGYVREQIMNYSY